MQILQFVFGTALAASHLFIYYSIPFPVPHAVTLRPLTSVLPSVVAAVNDTPAGGMGSWLKKLALRAAGHEGVAANVANTNGTLFGPDGARAAQATLDRQEIRYTMEPRTFRCVDTSGQAFAVWLNVFYLVPLTWLFARFFIRSYLRRTSDLRHRIGDKKRRAMSHGQAAERAGLDALKGVTREIQNAVIEMNGDGTTAPPSDDQASSGASTPAHPDAYEANVDKLLNKKQAQAERRYSATTKHSAGVQTAKSGGKGKQGAGNAVGTRTPVDVTAYEANIEDLMTRKQQAVEDKMHRPAKQNELQPPQVLHSSKEGIRTPLDERGYEANVEDVMTPAQKWSEFKVSKLAASKDEGDKTDETTKESSEAAWVPVRGGGKAGGKKNKNSNKNKDQSATSPSSSTTTSRSPPRVRGSEGGFDVLQDEAEESPTEEQHPE